MNEQKQIIDENTSIICPWCLNITEFNPNEEEQRCKICARDISLEDLDDEKD
jgi:hypothetical protein